MRSDFVSFIFRRPNSIHVILHSTRNHISKLRQTDASTRHISRTSQKCIDQGWTITDDPLIVPFGTTDVYIDLGAEKLIAAEKEGSSIAVEIKSFLQPSVINDFHNALGQFLNYRFALEQQESQRMLYLAIPFDAYCTFFAQSFIQKILQQYKVAMLVYLPDTEEVYQWISW